uniref:Uncharacterized protein n=1 Tax=Trichogramma kaykai TaxID=54128 RepID=A0ABD2WZA4_9HYME
MRRKLSKQASTATLRTVLGIPSEPGADTILTSRYAHRSSSTLTSEIRCSSSTSGAPISRGMTDGNSVDTAHHTKSGAVGGDVQGALRRDLTVLYGLPHTSRSASSQSCLQQRRLLTFMASRSVGKLLVTYDFVRTTTCSLGVLRERMQYRLHSAMSSFHE